MFALKRNVILIAVKAVEHYLQDQYRGLAISNSSRVPEFGDSKSPKRMKKKWRNSDTNEVMFADENPREIGSNTCVLCVFEPRRGSNADFLIHSAWQNPATRIHSVVSSRAASIFTGLLRNAAPFVVDRWLILLRYENPEKAYISS